MVILSHSAPEATRDFPFALQASKEVFVACLCSDMRERIEIYACGSNLHQQICGHYEENGEPLTLDTPTFVDLNDETAVQVLAISASQIIYSINEGIHIFRL